MQKTSAPRRERRERGERSSRRKICSFCHDHVREIDYKDAGRFMKRYISDRGKIRSRRVTGLSRRHQQQLALAVKRAREVALLPYVSDR